MELSYDSLDQQTKVRVPKSGSSNWLATFYGYDLHGNRTSVEANREETEGGSGVAAGRVSTFAYDALDRAISQVDDFATGSTSDDEQILYTYTDRDELATQTLKKGGTGAWATEQSSERTYFDNGLLRKLMNKNASGSMLEQHVLSYVQDGIFVNGNRTSDVYQLIGPTSGASCYSTTCTATWTYDARDRLVAEDTGAGISTTFGLDVAGNVIAETPSPGAAITRTYSGLRLATQTSGSTTVRFLYDGYGNQDCAVKSTYAGTTCPASGSDLLEDWSYDYKNRLSKYRSYNGSGGLVNSVSWTSDPLDRPVAEASTASGSTTSYAFTYIGASDLLAQEVLTGATSATRTYGYDAYDRRATMSDNANRYSYFFDPHGSVSMVLDFAGINQKASYGYTAYGSPVSSLTKTSGFNASVNAYRYTGKRLDTGSGTLDMGARRYALDTDRFLQVDQYHGALDNFGLSLDPLTQNRYALAAGNPVTYVEVDGHKLIAEMFAGADAGPARTSPAASRGGPEAGGAGGRAPAPRTAGARNSGQRGVVGTRAERGQSASVSPTRARYGPEEGSGPKRSGKAAESEAGAIAASRAAELQAELPAGARGRVTMGVGVLEDASGNRITVVATSEPRGYLRPGVRLRPGEVVVHGPGHAEADIVAYAEARGYRVVSVAAGRPICPTCAGRIAGSGGSAATPLKGGP